MIDVEIIIVQCYPLVSSCRVYLHCIRAHQDGSSFLPGDLGWIILLSASKGGC